MPHVGLETRSAQRVHVTGARLHRGRAALPRRHIEVCGACTAHGCLGLYVPAIPPSGRSKLSPERAPTYFPNSARSRARKSGGDPAGCFDPDSRQRQRCAGGTSPSTCSTWAPQPAKVGRPHFRQSTRRHIRQPLSSRPEAQRSRPRRASAGPRPCRDLAPSRSARRASRLAPFRGRRRAGPHRAAP